MIILRENVLPEPRFEPGPLTLRTGKLSLASTKGITGPG